VGPALPTAVSGYRRRHLRTGTGARFYAFEFGAGSFFTER